MDDRFRTENYFAHLKTKFIGRICKYYDTVDTTLDLAFGEPHGAIVIADQQLKGRGQRNRVWQSPLGCAVASIRIAYLKSGPLAHRLSFLQHFFCLAAIKTITQICPSKFTNDKLRLKWPNDIVYEQTKSSPASKIGGVLVHVTDAGINYDLTLSFGLNVFNSSPTLCIRDIVGSGVKLDMATIIADIVNNLEDSIYGFSDDQFEQIKSNYIDRCIHMGKLVEDEVHGKVLVKEVDDDGYLKGIRCSDSRYCTITRVLETIR